jgi:hypothetical protein
LNLKRFARLWSKSPDQPTLSSLDAYAQWADTYPPHAHNALMQTEERTMLDLFLDVTGKAALDLACGTGRYGRIALERGAKPLLAWITARLCCGRIFSSSGHSRRLRQSRWQANRWM